jgi:hypothetical protein
MKGDLNMKNGNKVLIVITNAGIMSLLSFAAIANPSTSATFEKMVQAKAEQRIAAEENKYTKLVTLAGSRQNDLKASRNEVASTYKNWNSLKLSVVSHYPSANDYKDVENAAKAYSTANKKFIDLQKSILAQDANSLDAVAINSLLATSPTAAGMK